MSSDDTAGTDSVDRPARDGDRPQPMPLADLSALSLPELLVADRPELADCLARLIREAMDPGDVTSGFNSVV